MAWATLCVGKGPRAASHAGSGRRTELWGARHIGCSQRLTHRLPTRWFGGALFNVYGSVFLCFLIGSEQLLGKTITESLSWEERDVGGSVPHAWPPNTKLGARPARLVECLNNPSTDGALPPGTNSELLPAGLRLPRVGPHLSPQGPQTHCRPLHSWTHCGGHHPKLRP